MFCMIVVRMDADLRFVGVSTFFSKSRQIGNQFVPFVETRSFNFVNRAERERRIEGVVKFRK